MTTTQRILYEPFPTPMDFCLRKRSAWLRARHGVQLGLNV